MGAQTLKVPTIFLAVDKMSVVFDKMSKKAKTFNEKLNDIGKRAAIGGLAIAGGLGIALNSAITFEDRMADVAKTTGLSGASLENYGKSLLGMSKDTRTSIEDLQKIGEIGGQLGVASKDLISFTEASNKFSVALGSDYGGTEQAITQVGKIHKLFKETRNLDIAEVITKSGSAINELGAVGAGTSDNINDFVLRIGALPDAIKPSLQATAALGTFFEEAGIDAQIASGGITNLLLVAGREMAGFARQMGMTESAAKTLLSTDPAAFATKFAQSLKNLSPDKLAKTLEQLKVGSQETIKVVGALGSGQERLSELMGVSSKAFEEGISLNNEYQKKNDTTAAKVAIAKNNFEALSITIGTQIIPVFTQMLQTLVPMIETFGKFISDNPMVVNALVLIAGSLLAIRAVTWGVVGATAAYNVALGIASGLGLTNARITKTNTIALKAWYITQRIMTAGTWLATAATTAFGIALNVGLWPITLIIAAIAAVIALILNWDSVVAWFGKQWEKFTNWISELWGKVVSYFENFSFSEFFKDIGRAIIDFMLLPLRGVLKLLSYLPGKMGEMAQNGLDKINEFTGEMGISHVGMSKVEEDKKKALESPQMKSNRVTQETIQRNTLDVSINDPGNNVKGTQMKGPMAIPVKLSSTQGQS